MLLFILRRLMTMVPTFFIIVVVSFFIIRLAPGSPFSQERAMAPELRAQLEARYGLDQPLWQQLGRYVYGMVMHQDLGVSMKYPGRSVNSMLRAGLPNTLMLGTLALCWALILGLTAGICGALYHNRWPDHVAMLCAMVGLSLPAFVLGPIMVLGISLTWHLLPPAGWGSARHLVLPSLTLGTVYAAYIARLCRAGVLEVLQSDFVRTARAKGMPPMLILRRHVLRAGIMPVVSFLGPATASLLVGSVVVEKIFNVPGIGPYFVDAAFNRDYFLVMGVVVLESVLVLGFNLLVDILYGWLDPRIRLGQ